MSFVCIPLALGALPARAQEVTPASPELATRPWPAQWISHPSADRHGFGVFHFRKSFDLSERPERFVVHVSADNRYRLFVNGAAVSSGPARGDLLHWRYETVDLAPHLEIGRNVLAAVVWNFADLAPVAQHTLETAFLLQGEGALEQGVNTDASWLVMENAAYEPIPMTGESVDGYYAVGPGERIDARQYPWGWERTEFEDSSWPRALELGPGVPRGAAPYGVVQGWTLIPRKIPPLEETPLRLSRVRRVDGIEASDAFLGGETPVRVPANTRATLLVDQGFLTTAYPALRVTGGAGGRVQLRYAESLVSSGREKGHRDEIEGKSLFGNFDTFLLDGGAERSFRTLWFRTYRYIQLEIETAGDPLTLLDLTGTFTAYPFEQRGSFASDDPILEQIWNVGWRTARLCAGEHYYDCPYYEQLQYVGDTRIQALISLYVAGDDRLVRRALTDFYESRLPEGLTGSRHPSRLPQVIPSYALYWVSMVHDYWMLREDASFVASFLTGVRGVLDWFESYVDDTGLLSATPWWNFFDWTDEYPHGVPPGSDDGHSCILSLQYALTLGEAAELANAFGRSEEAAHYQQNRARLTNGVLDRCWDDSRELFADEPGKRIFSQHVNTLAVLADAVPGHAQSALVDRVLSDTTLVQASFYYQFYLHQALLKTGLADRYLDQLDGWRSMLDLGLTTFAEKPDPTRSDCHAWSASPNYFLLSLVAGIRPQEPGFNRVVIAPSFGPLRTVAASLPHPKGEVVVELERSSDGQVTGWITLPAGLDGEFRWKGTAVTLGPGRQKVSAQGP